LQVDSPHPAFLVAAEGFAPGWKASIDGKPAPVYPANLAFLGLPVPAGKRKVTLFYSPTSLYWWGALSAIAWILLAASVIRESFSVETAVCCQSRGWAGAYALIFKRSRKWKSDTPTTAFRAPRTRVLWGSKGRLWPSMARSTTQYRNW